jgi:hypothetical protein
MARFAFRYQENDVYELFVQFSVLTGFNFAVNIVVFIGFEVNAAATMKSTIIWLVTPSV